MRFLLTISIVLAGTLPSLANAEDPSLQVRAQEKSWGQDRRVFMDPDQSKIKDLVDSLLREDQRAPADSGQMDQSSNSGAKSDN